MENITVKGLVLKSIDYKEKDKIINILSFEEGKITVNVKGCNSIKSKLVNATIPKTFAQFELVRNNDRYILSGFETIDNFYSLNSNIKKYYISEIIIELIDKISYENDENEQILLKTINYLKYLTYDEQLDSDILLIHFLIDLLRSNSFNINLEKKCGKCGNIINKFNFSYNNLSYLCEKCIGTDDKYINLPLINVNILNLISINSLEDCGKFSLEKAQNKLLLQFLANLVTNNININCNSLSEYIKNYI